MSENAPTLHMLCGKIASGKSTLAAQLAKSNRTVLIAEDNWLNVLYGDSMRTIEDYLNCAGKLRQVLGPHVTDMLGAGVSVVLDFQANTIESRQWMHGLLGSTGASHQLHVLDVPEEICLTRLRQRNVRGEHPFAVTEQQFRQVSRHFVKPTEDEGFQIVWHGRNAV